MKFKPNKTLQYLFVWIIITIVFMGWEWLNAYAGFTSIWLDFVLLGSGGILIFNFFGVKMTRIFRYLSRAYVLIIIVLFLDYLHILSIPLDEILNVEWEWAKYGVFNNLIDRNITALYHPDKTAGFFIGWVLDSITVSGGYILAILSLNSFYDKGPIYQIPLSAWKVVSRIRLGKLLTVIKGLSFLFILILAVGVFLDTSLNRDPLSIQYNRCSPIYDPISNVSYFFRSGPIDYAIVNDSLYSSYDNGFSWGYDGDSPMDDLIILGTNKWYGLTNNNILHGSTIDNGTGRGTSTSLIAIPSASEILEGKKDTDNVIYVRDNNFFLGVNEEIYFAKDVEGPWSLLGAVSQNVQAMVQDATGRLYVGVKDGIYIFDDIEGSWERTGYKLENYSVEDLLIDHMGQIYATLDIGLYRSLDGGETWSEGGKDLASVPIVSMALFPNNALYIATVSDLYVSMNQGDSFELVNLDFTQGDINSIIADDSGNLYVASTTGVDLISGEDLGWNGDFLEFERNQYYYIDFENKGEFFLYVSGAIYRLDEKDKQWVTISESLPQGYYRVASAVNKFMLVRDFFDDLLYSSLDGGKSWAVVNTDELDGDIENFYQTDDMVYLSTSKYLYRSGDYGRTWEKVTREIITEHSYLFVDSKNSIFLGTGYGEIVQSFDHGETWSLGYSATLEKYHILSIVEGENNQLFAISKSGLFKFNSQSKKWILLKEFSEKINSLAIDTSDRLFIGAERSVYYSEDSGLTWGELSSARKIIGSKTVKVDSLDRLYIVNDSFIVFRSNDIGESWEMIGRKFERVEIRTSTMDEQGNIYAATGRGLYLSEDGCENWTLLSRDYFSSNIRKIRVSKSGDIFVHSYGEVRYSEDGGKLWQSVEFHPQSNNSYYDIAVDNEGVYVWASSGIYYLENKAEAWERIDNIGDSPFDISNIGIYSTTVTGYAPDGREIRLPDGGWQKDLRGNIKLKNERGQYLLRGLDGAKRIFPLFAFPASEYYLDIIGKEDAIINNLNLSGEQLDKAITQFMEIYKYNSRLYAGQDISIFRTEDNQHIALLARETSLNLIQLPQDFSQNNLELFFQVWVHYTVFPVYSEIVEGVWGYLLVFIILFGSYVYMTISVPYSVPFLSTLINFWRIDKYITKKPVQHAFLMSRAVKLIRYQLLAFGEVRSYDLFGISSRLRNYALQEYGQLYGKRQTIDVKGNQIHALIGDRGKQWLAGWHRASDSLGVRSGLAEGGFDSVDDLMSVLEAVLGFNCIYSSKRIFESAIAYQVEAPALRLNLPIRFPVIFLADQEPDAETIDMLVNTIDVMKERGFFAIVIPLEIPRRQIDVVFELKREVRNSPRAHDFIVFGHQDIEELILSRQPTQSLIQNILAQIDLNLISPFLISGPVPETMFFGRDSEVRQLLDNLRTTDFAIVGNRKIGKTSLLRRVSEGLKVSLDFRPIWVDCQAVKNAADYFNEFEAQTGIKLENKTVEEFKRVLMEIKKMGPMPILVMDEVDALLYSEKSSNERLAATWRSLSQHGDCHFVFCGSTGLALRLDDPKSVFFNFPQPMMLGYLPEEKAKLVISQSLETLGIDLEDKKNLLSEMFDLTSGHPNLVQYVGKGLVEAVNSREERIILLEDLEGLRNSTELAEYFLKTIWGEAGHLEKLVTLLAPSGEFRLQDIENRLEENNVSFDEEGLDESLRMLRIYSLITKQDRNYSFVPRAFKEILNRTQDVERLVRSEKRKMERNNQ